MKTKPKRLLAVLLTLCLALSIVPMTAFAAEIDFLPQGVTYLNDLKHTYHTQVNVTANVSVKDSNGAVVETTQVSKSSGEFNFITEGFPSAEVLQTAVGNLQTEIETPYKARGTVTSENESAGPIIDHFESASLYTFTPTSGNPVDFSSDLEAAKQYFNEHPDATGTFTEILDVHEYQKYNYTYDLNVQQTGQPESTITAATIENVKFDYQLGDAPQATAAVAAADQGKYRIYDECWQELNENDEPVAIWHSNDRMYSTLPTITAFESGKKYVYSVLLMPEGEYDFARKVAATVNGNTVTAVPAVDGYLSLPNVKTIRPQATKEISVIEINNATLTFKDGDKPVFTGTTPDDAPYVLVFEEWRTDGEWTRSDEWFNNADHHGNDKDITAFDKNKSYNYTLYIKINSKGAEEGWYFGQNTKLKINEKEVSFTRDVSDSEYHFSGATGITMTPTADGHTHSYGKAWIYDSANHWHKCSCGDKSDTAAHTFKWVTDKEATATEKGSKHEECSVCGYKKAAVEIPATGSGNGSADQPAKPGNTSSPQTGDNNSLALWFAVLLVSGGVLTVLGIISKKKSKNALK